MKTDVQTHDVASQPIAPPPQYLVLQPLEYIDGSGVHATGAIIAAADLIPESIAILEALGIVRVATRQDVRDAAAAAAAESAPTP